MVKAPDVDLWVLNKVYTPIGHTCFYMSGYTPLQQAVGCFGATLCSEVLNSYLAWQGSDYVSMVSCGMSVCYPVVLLLYPQLRSLFFTKWQIVVRMLFLTLAVTAILLMCLDRSTFSILVFLSNTALVSGLYLLMVSTPPPLGKVQLAGVR